MNTPKTIFFLKVFTPIIYFSFFFSQDIKEQVLSTYDNGAKKEVLKVFASDDYYVKLERIEYSKHGKPTFVESFFDNRSVKREYHSNRKLKREINYKDGILDGQILEYFENGQLKCSFIYDNGEIKPGRYSSYYINGFLEDTYTLGEVKEFHDNGNLRFKAFAIDTITYKSSIKYNDFLKSFVDTTTLGLKYNGDYKKYFEDGKLKLFIENINWDRDLINMENVRVFNETGNLVYNFKIYKSLYHDEYKAFFDNGQKKITGQYSKGFKTGLWLEFDDEGNVIVEENWHNGIRVE